MFSGLFGKKERKKTEKTAIEDSNNVGVAASDGLDDFESIPFKNSSPVTQRDIAKNTVAKIDAIEHEMTLDFARANTKNTKPAESIVHNTLTMPVKMRMPNNADDIDNGPPTLPPLDASTSIILGNNIPGFALEINASQMPAVLEETAILYANGQGMAALHILSDVIRADKLGSHTKQAWHMLFELYQALNKQTEFDSLALDYVGRFESSPPTWKNPDGAKENTQTIDIPNNNNANIVINTQIDASFSKYIEQLKRYLPRMPLIRLDFTKVQQIDEAGCSLLLELFETIKQATKITFEINGLHTIINALDKNIEIGRRDESDKMWVLYLDVLQLLKKIDQFEEACINYCITYEVSPPSFVAPPAHLRFGEKNEQKIAAPSTPIYASDPQIDNFSLTGVLEGKTDTILSRLTTYASTRQKVEIDCAQLQRVDFSAAGALLNSVVNLQANNKKVTFNNLSNLISALFITMGIHEFALLNIRKN